MQAPTSRPRRAATVSSLKMWSVLCVLALSACGSRPPAAPGPALTLEIPDRLRQPAPAEPLPARRLTEADLAADALAARGAALKCEARAVALVELIDKHNAAAARLAAPPERRGWWPW